MLEDLLKIVLSIPQVVILVGVFLLTAAETALFLGFVIPGELVVILAGAVASRSQSHALLLGVIIAGVLGPIIGDSIGYRVGRRYRRRLLRGRRRTRTAAARGFLRRRGALAVFLARFTAFLRSMMPAAAGAARMPYGRFLLWDIPAGVLWGGGSALLGYFAGRDLEKAADWAGHLGLALFVLAVAAAGVFLWHRRRRAARARRARGGSRPAARRAAAKAG